MQQTVLGLALVDHTGQRGTVGHGRPACPTSGEGTCVARTSLKSSLFGHRLVLRTSKTCRILRASVYNRPPGVKIG